MNNRPKIKHPLTRLSFLLPLLLLLTLLLTSLVLTVLTRPAHAEGDVTEGETLCVLKYRLTKGELATLFLVWDDDPQELNATRVVFFECMVRTLTSYIDRAPKNSVQCDNPIVERLILYAIIGGRSATTLANGGGLPNSTLDFRKVATKIFDPPLHTYAQRCGSPSVPKD